MLTFPKYPLSKFKTVRYFIGLVYSLSLSEYKSVWSEHKHIKNDCRHMESNRTWTVDGLYGQLGEYKEM